MRFRWEIAPPGIRTKQSTRLNSADARNAWSAINVMDGTKTNIIPTTRKFTASQKTRKMERQVPLSRLYKHPKK